MIETLTTCPCGTGKEYSHCCGIYHQGQPAPTAEALMRSRYSAYAIGHVDYIIRTTWPCQQPALEQERAALENRDTTWIRLDIIRTESGKEQDTHGIVEFKAWYQEPVTHHENTQHEVSDFIKEHNQWFYIHPGLSQSPCQIQAQPGRNDPCSCGSGKKYKKCCMK